MKDVVIVQSKTINNESVGVVINVIKPHTGEAEKREITRFVVFKNFQAEVPVKMGQTLVSMNPQEFSIVGSTGELSAVAKRVVNTALEKIGGFKCEHCGAEAKSRAGLTSHTRYTHPEKWEGRPNAKVSTN